MSRTNRTLKLIVGTVKKSIDTRSSTWFFKNARPRRGSRFARTNSILLYRRFCDFDAKLAQLPDDTRRTPFRIGARYSPYQILDFLAHSRSAGQTTPADTRPMLTESSSSPSNDRQGLH